MKKLAYSITFFVVLFIGISVSSSERVGAAWYCDGNVQCTGDDGDFAGECTAIGNSCKANCFGQTVVSSTCHKVDIPDDCENECSSADPQECVAGHPGYYDCVKKSDGCKDRQWVALDTCSASEMCVDFGDEASCQSFYCEVKWCSPGGRCGSAQCTSGQGCIDCYDQLGTPLRGPTSQYPKCMDVNACEPGCTPTYGLCDGDLDQYCPCAACEPNRTAGYIDNCGNISCKDPSVCSGGGGGDNCNVTCPCTVEAPDMFGDWLLGSPAGHPAECLATEICGGLWKDCTSCFEEQDYYLELDDYYCGSVIDDPPTPPTVTNVSGSISGPADADTHGGICDANNPATFTVTYTDADGWADITKVGLWIGANPPSDSEADNSIHGTLSKGSNVAVFAQATSNGSCAGEEAGMELLVNDEIKMRWDVGDDLERYDVTVNGYVKASDIKIRYVNDCYSNSSNNLDLIINKMALNGLIYNAGPETLFSENDTVGFTGTYTPGNNWRYWGQEHNVSLNDYFWKIPVDNLFQPSGFTINTGEICSPQLGGIIPYGLSKTTTLET